MPEKEGESTRVVTIQSFFRASLIVQLVKNLPTMQEIRVRLLGWEDPLEKEMVVHSSILAWKIPQTEEPVRLQSMGSQEPDTTEQLNHHQSFFLGFVKTFTHTGNNATVI